ncbi:MerR family DNA-binding transcriptional regulator [Enterococcus sp. AZ094]|uniref:MerR family DNA-binding transcriptional regulator n=1 Tax=Enterococcus sp. AZ094 TaxID=2774702 RepID=UPI003F24F4B7
MKTKLKVSEMARLARINPRTLHYYDEIGLFQPNSKDENGYRYYSLDQLLISD